MKGRSRHLYPLVAARQYRLYSFIPIDVIGEHKYMAISSLRPPPFPLQISILSVFDVSLASSKASEIYATCSIGPTLCESKGERTSPCQGLYLKGNELNLRKW